MTDNYDEKNKSLSIFLKNLAYSIDDNTITNKNLKLIGEFYMKYTFYENNKLEIFEDIQEQDLKKFIFLGWFIYCIILKDNKI